VRIKNGFYFDLIIGALLILAAGLAFIYIQLRLEAAVVEKEVLDRAVNRGMELVQVTGEVLLYGEPRAIAQWREQSERLAGTLARLDGLEDARGREIIAGLNQVRGEMLPLFERLTAIPADGVAPNVSGDGLLSSQLFRKSVQMQAGLRDLFRFAEDALEDRYARSKELMLAIFGAFIGALALFGLFVSFKFRNFILRPVENLRETIDRLNAGERTQRARVFAEDEVGVVSRTLNALLDEEMRSRAAVEEAAERFRAIFEQAAVGLARVGLDGQLLQTNGKLGYIVGRGPHELADQPLAALFHPDDRDLDRELFAELLAGQRATYAIERRLDRDRDNGGTWVNQTVSLARAADGAPQYFIHVFEDVTARRRAEGKADFLAHHDALTGLPNQVLVKARLEQALAHADRSGGRIALIFIDLDNFKTINDSLGHPVGDALLKEIAARLLGCVRDTDMVSRKGGDEFLVALTEVDAADDIGAVADKLLERLAAPALIDGHELGTTASIGIAIYPDDSRDFDTLLKKADTAMYQAKAAGRNGYRFFTEQMNVAASEYLTLRNGLRRALDAGEFALHYQPQVDLETERVFGVEALLRWNGAALGPVPPARFIPVAEESGLIVPIGAWVIREACRQVAAWDAAGLPELTVAVNLSAVQFQRVDLEESVVGALAEFGVAPHRLELELTESTLIQDTENVIVTLGRLKALGISLSIDDFGTGYSSLSYLKRFNVDRLKIDQSFVRGLANDLEYVPIVRAIIQLARSFGLRTVAEGVEDGKILERLRLLGCDEVQGYHIARPLPPEGLVDFLVGRPHRKEA
jgi:diguanylate cyclase (GGDEF)-like protein/PAS domain S-box-containing protein